MNGMELVARVGKRRAVEPEKLGVGFGLLFPFLVGHFIYFRCPSCSSPLSSLCLRCTTSDEVVTLTRTHVIWDSRTRVPNQPF